MYSSKRKTLLERGESVLLKCLEVCSLHMEYLLLIINQESPLVYSIVRFFLWY